MILVGQLGRLRRLQASEHSWELIESVVARLGSSNVKCLGRDAPTLSSFFETPEVKNESSEALLMSHMKRTCCVDTKFSISKVDFLLEKFHFSLGCLTHVKSAPGHASAVRIRRL